MEGDLGLAEGIPARLSATENRKFGLTVGGTFAILGAISRWRGHDVAPYVLWSLGGALLAGGLLVPRHLDGVRRGWMGFAHALSKVTTPIFMGVVYFLVLTPMGVVRRLFGHNTLVRAAQPGQGYWVARTPRPDADEAMRRQF